MSFKISKGPLLDAYLRVFYVIFKQTILVEDVDNGKLEDFMIPPSTLSIKSNDIYYRCGDKSFSRSLLQKKKKHCKRTKIYTSKRKYISLKPTAQHWIKKLNRCYKVDNCFVIFIMAKILPIKEEPKRRRKYFAGIRAIERNLLIEIKKVPQSHSSVIKGTLLAHV